MPAPAVSVLLPAWNAAATLGPALRSIQRQSFSDFECLVVDDGSDDATAATAESFARADARFKLLQGPRAGVAGALSRGLGACRGRFIARMDADDLAHRARLELQVARLEREPALAAVGAWVWMFPRHSLSDGLRAHEGWLNSLGDAASVARDAFVECPIVHPTLCIRAELLRAYGYREMGWPQDYDLVLRLLAAGQKLAVVERPLLGWRDGPERVTRCADYTRRERLVACKAHHLALGFLAEGDRYVLWGYGDTGRALCRALGERGKRPELVVELHPGRIGQRIAGAPVVHPRELGPGAARIVISVSGLAARTEARARAAAQGLVEGRDFVVAA